MQLLKIEECSSESPHQNTKKHKTKKLFEDTTAQPSSASQQLNFPNCSESIKYYKYNVSICNSKT